MAESNKVIAIVGPTASGKSGYALELAQKLSGEIVNADSRQIYKYIPIGTAQPDEAAKKLLPHHLYGFLDPKESYNAGDYAKAARKVILDILDRKKCAIVVGGTGLYLRALFDGLSKLPTGDPTVRNELQDILKVKGNKFLHEELEKADPISAKKIPYQNIQRTLRALEVYRLSGKPISQWHKDSKADKFPIEPKWIGLLLEKEDLKERIRQRTENILPGMIEETKWLLAHHYPSDAPGLQSLGYKYIFQSLKGMGAGVPPFNLKKLEEMIALDTLHYAKRQMTWFRKDPRIEWIKFSSFERYRGILKGISTDDLILERRKERRRENDELYY